MLREVKVTWLDCKYAGGWTPVVLAETERPIECYSYGFLVMEEPHVVLSQTMASDGDVLTIITIPKGCIIKIEDVQWT